MLFTILEKNQGGTLTMPNVEIRTQKQFIQEMKKLEGDWFLEDCKFIRCKWNRVKYCPLTRLYQERTGKYVYYNDWNDLYHIAEEMHISYPLSDQIIAAADISSGRPSKLRFRKKMLDVLNLKHN